MSNLNAQQWYEKITNEGISVLEVWAVIEDLRHRENEITRLQSRVQELEAQLKEPIVANCFINGEGIKEGWSFSGCDDKCIVTPLPPKDGE